MELSEYVSDMVRRRELACAVFVVPAYLWQVATGRRTASPGLARRIHEATNGTVTLESLRPEIWPADKR
jgi:DNA-binding transcriptional regulator YdaS (Cro superfamily)